jgi:hypothetical protein
MLLFLPPVAISQTYNITTNLIAKYDLNPNDIVNITVAKSEIFLHVSPVLLGTLQIDAFWNSTRYTFFAKASDSLRFNHGALVIRYLRGPAPTRLSIWVPTSGTCGPLAIHSRDPHTAIIHFENFTERRCYFFQFPAPPTASFVDTSVGCRLLETSDSGLMPAPDAILTHPAFIVACDWANGSFTISFEAVWWDWSDDESEFAVCQADGCHLPDNPLDSFGLVVDRTVSVFVPVLSVAYLTVIVVIGLVLLFWSVAPGPFSFASGMRPLANIALLPIDSLRDIYT